MIDNSTRTLIDKGFRPYLIEQGLTVELNALEMGLNMGSVYRLTDSGNSAGGAHDISVIPREDGFVISVEVASIDVAQEYIESLRERDDGFSLVLTPATPDGAVGGYWSLGMAIGEDVWEEFPGWELVLADAQTARSFVSFLLQHAHRLREYVWVLVRRATDLGDNPREVAFGALQNIINNPHLIQTGEITPDHALEVFRRGFSVIPDTDMYEALRSWLAGQAMQEMAQGQFDGPWSAFSEGVREFGETRGWSGGN
ncbi:hypothetical protein ACXR2T_12130 [Leucobacter sp. HY1910]